MIPAVFLALTGLIKSLVRGKLFWSNFYLGIDIALAAFANGIINVVDLGGGLADRGLSDSAGFAGKMYYNAMLLVLSFGVLLIVMFMHQRLEERERRSSGRDWTKGILLGIVSNGLGAATLSVFIIGRLKGSL